ncbi:phasin family protein [Trinickia sp.]|uniref:phasin family protein n=1 Tax=Trinickia sp. TaxID=2571163 RepID=UPI003F8121A2
MSSPVIDYAGGVGHAGQAALASMVDLANQTFAGFERLTRLNLQTMKTMLAEQHGIALEAADSRSLSWTLTLPMAQAQAGFKKAFAYWQHVNEIAVETATQNAGAGLEGFRECARWLASAKADGAGSPLGESFLLTAAGAGASAAGDVDAGREAESHMATKAGGKKRSVDIVDGSGNVVSSVKQ